MGIKADVIGATARRFFPGWEVTSGENPEAWAKAKLGDKSIEIHIPNAIPLDEFEAECFYAWKKLKEDFVTEDSANRE